MKRRNHFISLLLSLVLILLVAAGCTPAASFPGATDNPDDLPSLLASQSDIIQTPGSNTDSQPTQPVPPSNSEEPQSNSEQSMTVHVIDVGQGHSVLVESNGEYILVDSGEAEYANHVLSYLRKQNVDKLNYAVATHPHSDHMGGFDVIINTCDIDLFLMPNAQNNTATFERMLTALTIRNTPVSIPAPGKTYTLGDIEFTVLSPSSSKYDDMNDYSIGLRFECGNTSFIVTGDATSRSESEMLKTGLTLDSDVMLVPHHGSSSSSSSAFVKEVSPEVAIISCGEDNSYGHPHDEIVDRYSALGTTLYRTDECGTIIIEFSTNSFDVVTGEATTTTAPSNQTSSEVQYIGNVNSQKFHSEKCSSLPSEHNRIYFSSREEAINAGYEPCGSCKP